jgi:hypothetical protein
MRKQPVFITEQERTSGKINIYINIVEGKVSEQNSRGVLRTLKKNYVQTKRKPKLK